MRIMMTLVNPKQQLYITVADMSSPKLKPNGQSVRIYLYSPKS